MSPSTAEHHQELPELPPLNLQSDSPSTAEHHQELPELPPLNLQSDEESGGEERAMDSPAFGHGCSSIGRPPGPGFCLFPFFQGVFGRFP